MTNNKTLKGVLPVLHTPYNEDFSIDYATLGGEIDFVYECGVDGIVLAMVTEVLRLSEGERAEMAKFFVNKSAGRGSVTISVGGESTHIAATNAKVATDSGADALMAIPPIATSCSESETRNYYNALLEASPLPIVVQDASSYVGKSMTAKFQVDLFNEFGSRLLFKPEAAPVGPVVTEMNRLTQNRVQIFEGSGGSMLVENYRRGIAGTMPGADLIDAIVALWRALENGDDERIYAISPLVTSLLALATSLDGYLAVEKYLLQKRGIFKNTLVRGPVAFELDDYARREIDRLFERLQSALRIPT